jgi:hypothetical protein
LVLRPSSIHWKSALKKLLKKKKKKNSIPREGSIICFFE